MVYQLLHNLDSGFMRSGTLEDRYVRGYRGEVEIGTAHGVRELCEAIYMRHNADNRPDGKTRPSLSVGDVVYFPQTLAVFTVDMMGFKLLVGGRPVNVLDEYPDVAV